MAFEDYKDLDISKETVSKRELKKLQKKYGVDSKCNMMTIRGSIICLAITLILTVAIIILYGNVIKLSIDIITGMLIAYFAFILVVVVSVYNIILRRDIKFHVYAALLGLDTLILTTSVLVANMVPITGTLQMILPIIGETAVILFMILGYMMIKSEPKK